MRTTRFPTDLRQSNCRRFRFAASLLVVVAAHAATPLPSQTFTVAGLGEGRGEIVNLPQPLTSGTWQLELELYGGARLPSSPVWGDTCTTDFAQFSLESTRYDDARTDTVSTSYWRKTLEVGRRNFPTGTARMYQGEYVAEGTDVPWRVRFTKEGTPKPLPTPGASFTVHGRGSPEQPIDLPQVLAAGMWRVELRFYGSLPKGTRGDGRFYLTSDSTGCAVVSYYGARRTRLNVREGGRVTPGSALDVRLVPRDLLWSVQFSKDGTPLPPEPAPPPEDCPADSACQPPPSDPPPSPEECPVERACLHQGKFWVTVDYYDGYWREAKVLKTANLPSSAAIFWFFDPKNPELLVKVLNGCAINGHWWVYGSAATDRNYDVVVRRRGSEGLRFRRLSPAVPISYTSGFPCLEDE